MAPTTRSRLVAMLVALLVTVPAVTTTASARAEPADYEVLYSERIAEFHGEGALAEGDAKAFRFLVSQPNVTRIDFVLEWHETGDRVRFSDPDTFSLTVSAPEDAGLRLPVERSDDGQLRVRADPINPTPEGGPSSSAQLERTLAENEGHAGMGEWTAVVKLEDVGNPEGAQVDEGNEFTLTAYLHYYEGVPMRIVTLEKPTGFAAAGPEGTWGWATVGLAGLASLLGVALILQQVRSRRSRAAVTDEPVDSPKGETAGRPER